MKGLSENNTSKHYSALFYKDLNKLTYLFIVGQLHIYLLLNAFFLSSFILVTPSESGIFARTSRILYFYYEKIKIQFKLLFLKNDALYGHRVDCTENSIK